MFSALADSLSLRYWYCFPLALIVCIICTSSGFSGSILFQPVFYFIIRVPLVQSIATGIATETIGMSWGAINYILARESKSAIDFKAFRSIVPFTTVGVLLGISVFVYFPTPALRMLVGVVVASIALYQIWLAGENRLGFQKSASLDVLSRPLNRLYQILAGSFSAATGTGVAEMSQPLLEEKAGLLTIKANATAILLEACADWLVTSANLRLGNIRFDILTFTVSGVLVGGMIGPRIASYLNPRFAKTVFGVAVTSLGFVYIVTSWDEFVALF